MVSGEITLLLFRSRHVMPSLGSHSTSRIRPTCERERTRVRVRVRVRVSMRASVRACERACVRMRACACVSV